MVSTVPPSRCDEMAFGGSWPIRLLNGQTVPYNPLEMGIC